MKKERLDALLMNRALFESRAKAQAAIMAGQVLVNEQKIDKPGTPVAPDVQIRLLGNKLPYVSRGGLKLEKALQILPISVEGKVVADIGASTGGFTDCALQNGAAKVYAIDVTHALADGSFLIAVRCGRGTYIRTLCHDIGEAMGTHAHMGYLLRASTGMFTLDDAHTLDEITAAEDLSALLVPMDRPLSHLPAVQVKPHAERFVRNGNALTRRELVGASGEGQPARLYLGERFAGIGRMLGDTMKFDAMLLE